MHEVIDLESCELCVWRSDAILPSSRAGLSQDVATLVCRPLRSLDTTARVRQRLSISLRIYRRASSPLLSQTLKPWITEPLPSMGVPSGLGGTGTPMVGE